MSEEQQYPQARPMTPEEIAAEEEAARPKTRGGRRKKADAEPEQQPPAPPPTADQLVQDVAASSGMPEEKPRQGQLSQLELAKKKLDRMKETNSICFKHQHDLGRIEDELEKFKYAEQELISIMEPKGAKMIPGFSFSDLEKQKQYVNFLTAHAAKKNGNGHAQGEDQRRGQEADGQHR